MHIAVIGSTGSTGVALIPQALERSHHLHLLARDPNKIPSSIRGHANVEVVKGDVNSREEIKRIVHASEITIIVVGAYENKPTTVHQDAVRSVLTAFETKTGPKRVVLLTTTLCNKRAKHPWIVKKILHFFISEMHKDHQAAMKLLEAAKDVDFTIVEPPQIVDAVQYGYTLREEGALPLSQLSYQDLAAFMLEVAESDKYKRKEIMICSAKPIKLTKEMNAKSRAVMWQGVRDNILKPVFKLSLVIGAIAGGYFLYNKNNL